MKFMVYLATALLALCLVQQTFSFSPAYRSKLRQSNKATAIIEDLQSAIEAGSKDNLRNTEQRALTQFSDGDGDGDGGAYIQQGPSSILQLQLALRDLIRAISRLERSIRRSRRG